jgi:hypothetical protein
MNFLIIVGIVLVVIAIVVYGSFYLTNRNSNIDPTYGNRFYGGKLKGGSGAFRIVYFILGLVIIGALIYGFNLSTIKL